MEFLRVFIRRPVFTAMLAVALLVFGLFSLPKIGVDQYPDVEVPVVTVTTTYPGADPETVERDVSKILEEPLATISGLETIKSVNVESLSQIVMQFKLEKPVDVASQEVRDKVSAELSRLPTEAKTPVVAKFDVGAAPIMTLALSAPIPVEKLTQLAKDVVKVELQQQDGVGEVEVVGGREREVRVVVDLDRLRAHGLAASDVAQAVRAQSVDSPSGRTLEGSRERIVRLESEARTVEEVRQLVVASPGGVPVRLEEVATVLDQPEEARSSARYEGQSAVAFTVKKQSGGNTVAVSKHVLQALPQIEKKLPAGSRLAVVRDNSSYIKGSISAVQEDLVFGAALAVVVVLLFLRNGRSTIVAAVALPTSVIGTVAAIRAFGFTFNMITMLALTLSIGLLIDDAIVVIENIVRRMEEGEGPAEAALHGTKQIAVAVLAVTLAIVAVFIPVAFMDGIVGRFFFQFGVTVAVAVLISYLVSMSLTPMMSAYLLRRDHGRPGALSRAIEAALKWLERGYERALGLMLRNRWKTLAAAVALLVATVALAPLLKFSFLPKEDQAGVLVKVDLPEDASLEATERQVADLAAQVRAMPGVRSLYTSAGGGAQQKVSSGELQVNLVPIGERAFSQQELQERMRATLVHPPDVKLSVQDFSNINGGGNNQTVQFNLRGADYAALIKASDEVTRAMKAHGGFVDVDSTYLGGKPQVEVRLDRERAASLGVQAGVVAQTLRAFLGGDKVTWYREGTDSYEIHLALPDAVRADPAALGALQIRGAGGQLVELRNVARLGDGEGPSQIDRQARQRQITVLANLQNYSLGEAMTFLRGYAATRLPPGVSADFDGDAKRLGETGAAFGTALLLGLILVYIILAAQFESLVDPFTIMLSLPFAVIGAIGSMLLARQQLTIFAMIGVIMLMGLVTKNGILLVEFARQLKEEGRDTFQALVEAGRVRLRPILMTTVAMIAGMVPVALAKGEGAETRVPMAIVIIGGLVSSTVLTLGVVPVVYSLLDGVRARLGRRKARPEPTSAPASAA